MKKLTITLLIAAMWTSAASAAIIIFDLEGSAGSGLLPGNETGSPVSTGSGGEIGEGISFDTDSNILTFNVGWGTGNGFTDLTGNATAAHFHGPADFNTSEGVILGLNSEPGSIVWDNSASSGSITGTVDLDEVTLNNGGTIDDLLNGLWYVNIHTTANSAGEIRANLVAVPEPSSAAVVGGLLAVSAILVRRLRKR